tara:strand:+ start:12672 stop:13412 length:741 start_codon:yes stop_codon:yes gene_type:complete
MIVKRFFDFLVSFLGLIIISPILLFSMLLVFLQDGSSPLYRAPRIGVDGKQFVMVKMRSMVFGADKNKVDSTSSNDQRITYIGQIIRRYKLDELTQLWNVLLGEMSLVGPRPQVKRDVDLYSKEESKLLTVTPGITDFSSIIFSDEGDILCDFSDPDLAYNQLIRPWKSKLGILYIEKRSFGLDIFIIFCTIISIISKRSALDLISKRLENLTDDFDLIAVSKRKEKLKPSIPPGCKSIVKSREVN